MSPTAGSWPVFATEVERFFSGHLSRPRKLFDAFYPGQIGSGRPAGPRELYWQTTIALAVAALEAGLEDVLFAAHGARQSSEGHNIVARHNSVDGNPRRWLVEDRLMAPSSQKLERILFMDFGVLLDQLPASATFTARKKDWSKGGAGSGTDTPGPSNWPELGRYLDTSGYIRNATAHGDAAKLGKHPTHCKGLLWLERENGTWSVQLPHALTALRATLAVFNTVAEALAQRIGYSGSLRLTYPNNINFPAKV